MNRNLVLAIVVAAALGIAAYVLLGNKQKSSSTTGAGGSGAASSMPPVPRRNPTATGSGNATTPADASQPVTPFQAARSRAMTNLQAEITQRISACAPPASTPPTPRPLRVILEHRAEASTAEKQQYLVKDVILLVANADDVTPEVRACIDQIRGMPVVMFVDSEAIPSEDPTMDETFQIPLP